MDDDFEQYEEPGRHVEADGRIVTDWPPIGRFRELWQRVEETFDDAEKHDVLDLLQLWREENSTLIGIVHEDGTVEDVTPHWGAIYDFINKKMGDE